jgi:hypothetical protein
MLQVRQKVKRKENNVTKCFGLMSYCSSMS